MQIRKHTHNTCEPTVQQRDAGSLVLDCAFGANLLFGFGFDLDPWKAE